MFFLSLTSTRFDEKGKQIQCKSLILRIPGCQSNKATFGVFWHIWPSQVLWAIKKQIFSYKELKKSNEKLNADIQKRLG